jgi:hypothetical protein
MVKSEALKEAQKKYYFKIKGSEKYKDSIKKAQQKYYNKNKDTVIKDYINKDKYCKECDKTYKYSYWFLHIKSKQHNNNIEAGKVKEELLKKQNEPIQIKEVLINFYKNNQMIMEELLSQL